MRNNWLEPDWPVPETVHALTTLRFDGVSEGDFASFNLASHVTDEPDRVQQNRDLLRRQHALPADPVWLEQIHSDKVVKADLLNGLVAADASYTDQSGIVCSVLTADCLPVLFWSAAGQSVAAAHAGWRGLLAGVLSNTVHSIGQNDVLAWLGPAIGPLSFEVGVEVFQAFVAKNPDFALAFTRRDPSHYLADIYQLARIELSACGVKQIYGGGLCTFTDSERFYSYRRDGLTGRMASLIWRD